jgi:hypothetical protein
MPAEASGDAPSGQPVPPPRLGRGIAWALLAKAAALALLYVCFFSPAHRPDVTPDRLAGALLAAPAPEPPAHD